MTAPPTTIEVEDQPRPPARPRRGRTALVSAALVGLVLAVLIGVLATSDSSRAGLGKSPLLGRPAPELSGASLLDGERFDLADASGRFVLVNFFATWCTPCRAEHDDLVSFARRHRAGGDARVVSVVFSDDPDDVERFFREHGGDWPVIDDGDGRIATDFGVSGVPESYLIGPEGLVRAKIVGGVEVDRLDQLLRRASAPAEEGAPRS